MFVNTQPACRHQPDERCRPVCTNRLPPFMVRVVRLCSRHRLFTQLALDTHRSGESAAHSPAPETGVSSSSDSEPCHKAQSVVTNFFGFPGDGLRHERVPYPDKIFVKRMVIRSYGLAAQL